MKTDKISRGGGMGFRIEDPIDKNHKGSNSDENSL
jgi:hypothetical protein